MLQNVNKREMSLALKYLLENAIDELISAGILVACCSASCRLSSVWGEVKARGHELVLNLCLTKGTG